MSLQADFRRVVYALSDALDLVGIDDVAHGKRVGIMAAECARLMGWDKAEVGFMFDLGLLHDIGVSSTREHQHLVEEFDWAGSTAHAETGFRLLRDFAPLADMALPIRYHHTHWAKLLDLKVDAEVARRANLILLVDRVDALTAPYYAAQTVLVHREDIRQEIAARAGEYFDPGLVDAFMQASESEAFWLRLEPRAIHACLSEMLQRARPQTIDTRMLTQLARIFASIVDAKSRFTAEHSSGVARLARYLGERVGLDQDRCDMLEIAGLLHDIGKLRVPDDVLEKPAALDRHEREQMNAHSFETYQILSTIPGFEEISRWAAFHHEEPDGRGYPFRLAAADLPLEARIMRVADITQAMVQDRPYRRGLDAAALRAFLEQHAEQGRIDAQVAALVLARLDEVMALARAPAIGSTR